MASRASTGFQVDQYSSVSSLNSGALSLEHTGSSSFPGGQQSSFHNAYSHREELHPIFQLGRPTSIPDLQLLCGDSFSLGMYSNISTSVPTTRLNHINAGPPQYQSPQPWAPSASVKPFERLSNPLYPVDTEYSELYSYETIRTMHLQGSALVLGSQIHRPRRPDFMLRGFTPPSSPSPFNDNNMATNLGAGYSGTNTPLQPYCKPNGGLAPHRDQTAQEVSRSPFPSSGRPGVEHETTRPILSSQPTGARPNYHAKCTPPTLPLVRLVPRISIHNQENSGISCIQPSPDAQDTDLCIIHASGFNCRPSPGSDSVSYNTRVALLSNEFPGTDRCPAPLPPPPLSTGANARRAFVEKAFGPHSPAPNEALAKLCDLIIGSDVFRKNRLEPIIDSEDGRGLLKQVETLPGFPFTARLNIKLSVFILLCPGLRCPFCRKTKSSPERAIGCVRSHLKHRPFVCGGNADECVACKRKPV